MSQSLLNFNLNPNLNLHAATEKEIKFRIEIKTKIKVRRGKRLALGKSSCGWTRILFLAAPASLRLAFTLIELLVVIAIVAILAGILIPLLGRAKESGRRSACLSQLHQIGVALQLYVDDHDNRMPFIYDALLSTNSVPATNTATIDLVLSNYLGSPAILECPSDRKSLFEQTGSSYAWNSLLNGQPADQLKVFNIAFDPHQIPVVFDKESFHRAGGQKRGVNYLYADGHIKNLLAIEGTK